MLRIEPIDKKHHVRDFDCGIESLNTYLGRFAYKNNQNNISRTFVLIDDDNLVHGYYSICYASIEFETCQNILCLLPGLPGWQFRTL